VNLCLACRDVHADRPGGLARATCDLAEALAGQGHTVHLLTDLPAQPPLELEGVAVHRAPALPGAGPFAAPAPETAADNLLHAAAVYREVRRIHEHVAPVDAVLAPLWRSEGAVCLLDDAFPTVISCMTSLRTLTEVDERYLQLPDIGERLGLERAALRRSPYLHGLTRSALDKTIDDYDLRPARAVVIGRGLRDRCPAGPDRLAPDPGRRALNVLFVGRIERRKGVDTLLAAVRGMSDAGVELDLTLAGPEAEPSFQEDFAQDAAARPGLSEHVRFVGAVSDRELDRLYRQADVVCVPSRYESHGIVVIEAMMFAKAIVIGSGGGVDEVVCDGREALVADADDPDAVAAGLRRLAGDHELRARLGTAARQRFEARFEGEAVAARMAALLGEAAAAHPRAELTGKRLEPRLAALITEVLGVEPAQALAQAAGLLDPDRYGPLAGIRAAVPPWSRRSAAPASADTRVTAVILTRDRPERLSRALDSLHHGPPPQILVIDNLSAPSAVRALASDCDRREAVRLHRSERNLGCAGGRRLGVELTDGELVLFLDDDAELMPGALEHLVAELDAHPEAGAVAATVIGPDGAVQHSGGSFELTDELATFALVGAGLALGDHELPATSRADWVPGTAVLIRRPLLTEFELDPGMTAYYEDNDWCLRVAAERPGAFRRSREAIAVHHQRPQVLGERTRTGRELTVALLTAHARFFERHGRLLCPWLFDVVPELRDEQGTCDLPAARLMLELVNSLGPDWLSIACADGRLTPMLERPALRDQLRRYETSLRQSQSRGAQWEAEIARLRQALVAQDEALAFLHTRHETLTRVEEGGWWRLRGHVLPLLRVVGRLRAATSGGVEAPAPALPPRASPDPTGPAHEG
jgi:glycosyltransferase involved in cell wall biosynthesis